MFIRVDKQKLTLSIIGKDGNIIKEFAVAVGTGLGNKVEKGDMKTPEGIFTVQEIVDARDWKYDFTEDSLGLIAGAYGPWFIRLDVPGQKGIGIHGTYDNTTIGKRISHGCIRMKMMMWNI
ncbi:MAG: L,D-transpeptidase [Chitinophagaceae bacterium]|nr:L,D-transpeptidase [Chitinophagaceae bacterium]